MRKLSVFLLASMILVGCSKDSSTSTDAATPAGTATGTAPADPSAAPKPVTGKEDQPAPLLNPSAPGNEPAAGGN